CEIDVAELDAAFGGLENPAEARQQCRLPTATWAQQNRQRAFAHLEVQAVDRPKRVPAAGVFDDEVFDAQIGHLRAPRMRARDRRRSRGATPRRSRATRSPRRP